MSVEQRRELILQQRQTLQTRAPHSWRDQLRGSNLVNNLLRLGFLLLVVSWGGLWRHAAGRRGSWSLWGGVAAGSTLALLGSLL